MKSKLILLAACAALAGCGILNRPAPVDPRSLLSRSDLDAIDNSLLLVELPAKGIFATLIPRMRNGDVVTWITADGVTLAFDRGILTGTRGLGDDLMGADVSGSVRALSAGTGAGHERRYSYLSGENQPALLRLQCDIVAMADESISIVERRHAVRRVDERCHSGDLLVQNSYWTGQDGTVWKSRQWIGPEIGYIETERLVK